MGHLAMKPSRKVMHLWGPRDFKKLEELAVAISKLTKPRYRRGAGPEPDDPENWVPITVTITNHGRRRNRIDGIRHRRENTMVFPAANVDEGSCYDPNETRDDNGRSWSQD